MSGEQTAVLEHDVDVLAVAGTANGLIASSAADGAVRLWRNGAVEQTLLGHEAPVHAVSFSRDASMLVSASADHTARVWATERGAPLALLRGHRDEVRAACFGARRSASLVVTGSLDGTALIWQLPSPGDALEVTPLHACKAHAAGITSLAIGENGQTLCTASMDKSVKLWTMHDFRFARTLPGGAAVHAVVISSAGAARVAAACGGRGGRGTLRVFGIVPRRRESGMFT
ncbi:unnamed protein product [Durusdinium trenchii]